MSIINEALKKTQDNLEILKEKTTAVTNGRIPQGQKTWQELTQPSSVARAPKPSPMPAPAVTRTSPSLPEPNVPTKPAGKRWYIIVFTEILILCLAAWTLFVIQPRLFRSSSRINSSSPAGRPISPQPAPATQSVPAPGMSPEIKFPMGASFKNNPVLNGIMLNQNKVVALINGEIYEVGDYLNGKKVTKITMDRVELQDENEVLTLSVRDRGR